MSTSSISKWRFFLFLIVAVSLAGVVINKAYQKNFNNKALNQTEQQRLQVNLLDFPRNMVPLEATQKTPNAWHFFYVKPEVCNALCQSYLAQLDELVMPVATTIIKPRHSDYQEIWELVRSRNYSEHFDKVLLLNPNGQFSGSVSAPYEQARMLEIHTLLQAAK